MKIDINCKSCAKEGACVNICPFRVFEIEGKNCPKPASPERCMKCFQCVAFCPRGAITIDGIGSNDCEQVIAENDATAEQVIQLLKSRRSVRNFQEKEIPGALVSELVDVIRWAPSAMSSHLVEWIVVSGKEKVKALSFLAIEWMRQQLLETPEQAKNYYFDKIVDAFENKNIDMIAREAPHVIFAHAKEDSAPWLEEDAATALTYLEIAAHGNKLGTCRCGLLATPANFHAPIRAKINLPEGHKIYGCVLLGYPKYKFKRIPPRDKAKVTQ